MGDGRVCGLTACDAGPPAGMLFVSGMPAALAADDAGGDGLRVALFFRCFVFGIASTAFLYD